MMSHVDHEGVFADHQGVITESKSGRMAILANRVIDCTGDADIAFLAGAQYRETSKVINNWSQ